MKSLKLHSLKLAIGIALLGSATAHASSMARGENGWTVSAPLLSVGETVDGYTPVGVLDGLGAFRLNKRTVRVLANHELLNNRGYPYSVSDGDGGSFEMTGARVSYFDIDRETREIVGAGLAYDTIYDANGDAASDTGFLTAGFAGLSRLCSSTLVEPGAFNLIRGYDRRLRFNRGLEDPIYFTGEEDGGFFNPVGGAEWALDVKRGELWQVPAMGRGAWENVTPVDTGNRRTVAFVLADDTAPFDFDNDGVDEAAPLFLYVGHKDRHGDFLARNGLRDGSLYVFVAETGETKPSEFNTSGTLKGRWVPVDNSPRADLGADADDPNFERNGYDEYGYPTQGNLWLQAEALGAFGFSRPEDVAYNPRRPSEVVLASTGVDNYDVDAASGNGADTFGTMYTIATNFHDLSASVSIVYDGDADPSRALRSPDNLDWSANGYVLVQEDEAEEDTASGDEVLFGAGAKNPNEAGIVLLDPNSGATLRVANIERSVVLDGSIADPTLAVDTDAGAAGEWESSGILDVSRLFGEKPGTLYLFDVQAHGIEDQDQFNAASRITDGDLVEGGQLLFLQAPAK